MPKKLKDKLVKPSVETARRILNLFFLPDGSTSMEGLKIATLNQAFRENVNELKAEAGQHPDVDYFLRCIAFASKAWWHIGPEPMPLEKASWKDLTADGLTTTGDAIQMLANEVSVSKMPKRGLSPVMVLLSDGANTDGSAYDDAIAALDKEPWGNRAIRLAIGIGSNYDKKQLEKFSNQPDVGVLEAKNAVDLANYIRYATVTAVKAASRNSSNTGELKSNVALPPLPAPATKSQNPNLKVF